MQAQAITPAQAAHHRSYEILESLLGLTIARVEISIRARLAGAELAALIGMAAEKPLLVVERVSFDPDERWIEFAQFHVNAEEYDLAMSVRGRMPVGTRLRMNAR
jgi:DNA-binding GntR family transcriptional regulator